MAGMAQSAVDSLLGRLSALLVDEAQLLRGVRGDVRFIRDEMESMNSLLAHLTEAQHRDHHVRTWMKQVVGLARDSEAYVELFARHVGDTRAGGEGQLVLMGFLRRMFMFLRTVPVRHRVATQIRELKVRVHDVGERQLRYSITVPSSAAEHGQAGSGALTLFDENDVDQLRASSWGQDIWDRSMLELEDEVLFNQGIDRIVAEYILPKLNQPPTARAAASSSGVKHGWCRQVGILQILWHNEVKDKAFAVRVAQAVYNHPLVTSSFSIKARTRIGYFKYTIASGANYNLYILDFLREILDQVAPLGSARLSEENKTKTQGHLRGQRFLIFLELIHTHGMTDATITWLLGEDGREFLPGSTIVTTSSDNDLSSPHYTIINPQDAIYKAIYHTAKEIIKPPSRDDGPLRCSWEHVKAILDLCYPDGFAMKMFLHLLQANPQRTNDELQNITDIVLRCTRLNKSISKQMLIFSYNELPSKYKSCLMYLSIFPKDCIITRTRLCRRWIAEGIINHTREYYSNIEEGRLDNATTVLEDVAKHHFEILVTRGFIRPVELSDACNIKTCTIHHETSEFIAKIAIDVNFVDTDNLPQGLAQHLSIHNRIPLQACCPPMEATTPADAIVASLPYLAKSSQWKLLKVLDLDGCRGLKKKHLKIICNILLLKYFSLKNTDITELPKQIEMLTCLETLDIRQTAVRAFSTKSVMLPMLKHMLAGQSKTHPPPLSSNSDHRFQESSLAVRLPNGIQRMKKLEMLSHVEVSNNLEDIVGIGELLRLRKLGVILHRKKGGGLLDLFFQQVEKLQDCLCSLSIIQQADHPVTNDGIIHDKADEVHALDSPPKLLQVLNIRGIIRGLPRWLAKLDHLVKLTLSETYLGEDDLGIIGNLKVLTCLRLMCKSYSGNKLHMKKGEFKCLKSLIVQDDEIMSIQFDRLGASPYLKMIVWSLFKMEGVAGIGKLPSLKKVELNGDCNPDMVMTQLRSSIAKPVLKHNGQHLQY